VARQVLESDYSKWPAGVIELMAEDVVLSPADGKVYLGHEGCALWYQHNVRTIEAREFVSYGLEQLDEEWVIGEGATRNRLRDGELEVQPGCWLVRVTNGLVSAFLYYRTADDAREALAQRLDQA
jgi:hypothetical protein